MRKINHGIVRGMFYAGACLVAAQGAAQTELYPQHFALHEVTLLDSPYKTAMDKNIEVLLQYDVDRLLTPFIRQAGLSATEDAGSKYYQWEAKHPHFENWGWNPSFALDGHIGGHYLTALSLAYAACHDDAVRQSLSERIDYMVGILKDCQNVFADNTEGLRGYIGGLPDNTIWTELYKGNNAQFSARGAWVSYYVLHKIFAGLRDAYIYAGNKEAKDLFKGVCDWGIEVVNAYSEDQMDGAVLWNEHGGMNEVYADAYTLFGEQKYLDAAKKYSHKEMLNGMQELNTTFLNHKHANTQVPKYIGFERIAQEDASAMNYKTAVLNFWEDVACNRTVCIGGNSVDEHFLAQNDCANYITHTDGPESCNTNNMLKLSENLFDDSHDAKYVDFYEKAMLNHILSTQDPATGGYVYFTSLRPQAYRVYSQVNSAMWCCVGTGMENHSKYGHFIYTHSEDNKTLYVNLFTASELNSADFALRQETAFPYGTSSVITVNKAGTYTIAIRHPSWTTEGYSVKVNGEDVTGAPEVGKASFVNVARTWSAGDRIEVSYPMELTYSACPNYEDYVAFHYGPVLLAAQTTGSSASDADYEELNGEYAGVGRMDHSPGCVGVQKNLTSAPMVLCERDELMDRLSVKDASRLLFEVDATREGSEWTKMELKPFYSIHHARYVVYWNQQTPEAYANGDLAQEEAAAEALEARTLDKVATGEQQSEAGHNAQSEDSGKGVSSGEHYRDAGWNGWFEFDFALDEASEDLSVMFRFNINDRGRTGIVFIDGEKLRTVTIPQNREGADPFYNVEYPIPATMLTDADGNHKTKLTIRMQGGGSTSAPGVYYMRLLKGYEGPQHYTFHATDWVTGDVNRVPQDRFVYDEETNTVRVTALGKNNICLNLKEDAFKKYSVGKNEQYLAVKASGISAAGADSYLWFLNGVNKGSSVEPAYRVQAEDGDMIVVWDVTKTELDDLMREDDITLSGSVLFGLTSTAEDGSAVLKDIAFYSLNDLMLTYPELSFLQDGIYDTAQDTRLALKGATGGVTAHGAIKFHPNNFAFLEMATKTYALNDYTGYELNFSRPIENISDASFSFNVNGWDAYEHDDYRKYQLCNGDWQVSGELAATVKSGTNLALGVLGITEIRNIWIQYGWGADDYIVELEEASLIRKDGTKEQLDYVPTHDGLSVYAANYTATADGQRICHIETMSVEGYKYLRIDLGTPASKGWKVACDGKVTTVQPGESTVYVPFNTDYSVVKNLEIYAEGADYPSDFSIKGMYLTNDNGGTEVPEEDLDFPLTASRFDCKIWPTGPETEGENAGHWPGDIEPSFDEATHTLITGLYGFGGWHYDAGLDLSSYTYLVAELEEQQSCGASFRIYDENTYWSEPYMSDMGEMLDVVVNLHEMTKNNGMVCDPSHLYFVILRYFITDCISDTILNHLRLTQQSCNKNIIKCCVCI